MEIVFACGCVSSGPKHCLDVVEQVQNDGAEVLNIFQFLGVWILCLFFRSLGTEETLRLEISGSGQAFHMNRFFF